MNSPGPDCSLKVQTAVGHTAYGATPEDWAHFDLALGLTSELLPVVSNPTREISPRSKMKDLGKTPSRLNNQDLVVGIPGWAQQQTVATQIYDWAKEPDYGICVQTRVVRAIDIDIADADVSRNIVQSIVNLLGTLPKRYRENSGKCLLALRLSGDYTKRIITTAQGKIEFLATGQQFIAVGTHPSGVRYQWASGLPNDIPEVSIEQFERVWQALQDQFGNEPMVEVGAGHKGAGENVEYRTDDVALHLDGNAWTIDVGREGHRHIRCPWEEGHSSGTPGDSSTTYFIPGGKFERGHFKCLHASCASRTDGDFLQAVGLGPENEFDVVEDDEESTEATKNSSTWELPASIGTAEWGAARSTPTCVVEHMLFADVATLVAPGGMGKTTLILFKAVHIALGRPLFGLAVRTPGPVLILTSEDSRELLVARLRHICQEMFLTDDELAIVRERVRISDLSGGSFKLTEVVRDVVRTTKAVKAIADAARVLAPVWLVIDPAVSFGVGESRVNDAEQGLIEAARYLRNHLPGCCVEYVHHTGKTNGRDKTIDQYSGRGGSAFADGSRMVMVMQSLNAKEWLKDVGEVLEPGYSGLGLYRAKLSYCPPQPPIYLRRRGYTFEVVAANSGPVADERQEAADKVWVFLANELEDGRHYSKNTLETTIPGGMARGAIRAAVGFLQAAGRLEDRPLPDGKRHSGQKTYLHPVEQPPSASDSVGEVAAKLPEL